MNNSELEEQDRPKMPSGHDLAYANGVRTEREAVIADLEKVIGRVTNDGLRNFAQLYADRLRKGLHRG